MRLRKPASHLERPSRNYGERYLNKQSYSLEGCFSIRKGIPFIMPAAVRLTICRIRLECLLHCLQFVGTQLMAGCGTELIILIFPVCGSRQHSAETV